MAIIQDRRSVEAKMGMWVEIEVWRRRRAELIREAQERALAREARKVRAAFAAAEDRPAGVPLGMEVRWGLAEDEPAVADLLELNGMPRWVAFEGHFIIGEDGEALTAAMRFRQEYGRLHLGLLVTDPRTEEHPLAVALYVGARAIARRAGLHEVRAQTRRHQRHLREAGYRRRGGAWRISP
jgi:hypothetical protein